MAFRWRGTIDRCLCVTGTWQGGGPLWMPCNGTQWRANAVEATVIVFAQCRGLSFRQWPGFISLRETGRVGGSWNTAERVSLSNTDVCNRCQRTDKRAVQLCHAVMCSDHSHAWLKCLWSSGKPFFKGTVFLFYYFNSGSHLILTGSWMRILNSHVGMTVSVVSSSSCL